MFIWSLFQSTAKLPNQNNNDQKDFPIMGCCDAPGLMPVKKH